MNWKCQKWLLVVGKILWNLSFYEKFKFQFFTHFKYDPQYDIIEWDVLNSKNNILYFFLMPLKHIFDVIHFNFKWKSKKYYTNSKKVKYVYDDEINIRKKNYKSKRGKDERFMSTLFFLCSSLLYSRCVLFTLISIINSSKEFIQSSQQ